MGSRATPPATMTTMRSKRAAAPPQRMSPIMTQPAMSTSTTSFPGVLNFPDQQVQTSPTTLDPYTADNRRLQQQQGSISEQSTTGREGSFSSGHDHHRMSFGSAGGNSSYRHGYGADSGEGDGDGDGSDDNSPDGHDEEEDEGGKATVKSRAADQQRYKNNHQHHQHEAGAPQWSEMKTKAGKERKRLPLACIACRRKKIRCSGEKPACKHCLRSRIPCVYKVTTRKAAPRTDYMAMLDKRLKRMEDRIIKIIPKDPDGAPEPLPFGRAHVKPAPAGSAGPQKKRSAEEAFGGTELEEWAKTKATKPPASVEPGRATSTDPDHRSLSEGAESLPPKEIQEHLAEVYFDCLYGQSYHLLHKPSFMRRIRAGNVPPVLMLALCGISARFSTHPQITSEPAFLRGEAWAAPAREIVRRRYDEPNIAILISLILLGLHEFGTCQGGRSWAFGGMAIRMAYALRLHHDLDHGNAEQLSATDREIRRRTMWACFLMDRFNSSGTDRPTFIDEETIKVQLPVKESLFEMEIPGPTENLDGSVSSTAPSGKGEAADPKANMGAAAYMIRAVSLWGHVVKYLNLGGKEKDPHPIWHDESEWKALYSRAESLKASFPSELQYTQENLHWHSTQRQANQFVFLHTIASQIVLFMNRSAISAPGGAMLKDAPGDFRAQMAITAIEAADNISRFAKDSTEHFVAAPFMGYAAYCAGTVHVAGVFSQKAQLEAASKRNLAHDVKYLSRMKKYWGMFHFLAEHLKDLYRQQADASAKGVSVSGRATPNPATRAAAAAAAAKNNSTDKSPARTPGAPGQPTIFHYGDWFDQYPHGVFGSTYEDPAAAAAAADAAKSRNAAAADTTLRAKSDLQSVEQYVAANPGANTANSANTSARRKSDPPARPRPRRQSIKQSAANAGRQAARPPPMHLTIPHTAGTGTSPGTGTHAQPNFSGGPPMSAGALDFHRHSQEGIFPGALQQPPPQQGDGFPREFDSPNSFFGVPAPGSGSGGGPVPSAAPGPPPPSLFPQLDRHFVYNAYAGIENGAFPGVTAAGGGAGAAGAGTTAATGSLAPGPSGASPHPASIWDLDLLGLNTPGLTPDVLGHNGPDFFNDQTSAWYMPFNLQPPELSDGDGSVGGPLSAPDIPEHPEMDVDMLGLLERVGE